MKQKKTNARAWANADRDSLLEWSVVDDDLLLVAMDENLGQVIAFSIAMQRAHGCVVRAVASIVAEHAAPSIRRWARTGSDS